jgi:surface protein
VTDMSWMFRGASSFNQSDLSGWDTSAVTDMSFMLYGASAFNQNLCAWKDSFPYSNATESFCIQAAQMRMIHHLQVKDHSVPLIVLIVRD